MGIHPKVAASTVATLAWTAVCLGLDQYAHPWAPNDAVTAAIAAFLTAAVGYFWPAGE